ncbi:hypothetical protein AB0I37_25075 [Micromonospora purpureochromogenes]|uniref:hypothetical protein n=1 Tax=Micromonospora purpureochromogenes TaxID=47872 RepID=UPI0033F341D9
MSAPTATVLPLGCAVKGCGVPRRRHDADDHTYQPPGMGVVLARSQARKRCGHWDGAEGRECGSTDRVRAFIQGPRCTTHDPNNMRGAA